MGKKNPGKVFEDQWKKSGEKEGLFVLRLKDTALSWQKESTARFTCTNPCDYIFFYKHHLFALELKSTKGESIGIERAKGEKKPIKFNQYMSLSNFTLFEDVEAGFIFNFRKENSEETYWLPIQRFNDFLCENEKGSINRKDVIKYGGTLVEELQLRTHYMYKITILFDEIIRRKEETSGVPTCI